MRAMRMSSRSITGLIAGEKHIEEPAAWFESTLERDLLLLLEFAPAVTDYAVQPVRIAYTDEAGRARSYTPDVLVRRQDRGGQALPPLLCEVKYRADAKPTAPDARRTLVRTLIAGRRYAQAHGWRFVLLTERDIREPYLHNARFLLTFRHHPHYLSDRERLERLVTWVNTQSGETADVVLASVTTSPHRGAQSDHTHCITALWHLLATGVLLADYTAPLTMQTRIYAPASVPSGHPVTHLGPPWLACRDASPHGSPPRSPDVTGMTVPARPARHHARLDEVPQ